MMEQLYLISIVIPMYNVEKYIGMTVDSIINQTYQNFEVILVDDGSTDQTSKIVEQYEDSRFLLLKSENHGASYARNWGQSMVKGDFLLFFDADDLMYPNMLEILLNGIISSGADLAIGNHNIIDVNGNILNEKLVSTTSNLLFPRIIEDLTQLTKIYPFPDTKLYKVSIVQENHILFPNAKIGEDLNFYLKYLRCCRFVWQTDYVICSYRILLNSMSHKNDSQAMMEITDSFDDVEKFYRRQGISTYYMSVLVNKKVSSYIYQANHWPKLSSRKEKLELLKFFYQKVKVIEKKNSKCFTDSTIILLKGFHKTWRRRWFYLSPLHEVYIYLKNIKL